MSLPKGIIHPDHELSFEELTRFNTWFTMHPKKVAEKEIITSSRVFPLTIKGTKEDIKGTGQDHTGRDRKIHAMIS